MMEAINVLVIILGVIGLALGAVNFYLCYDFIVNCKDRFGYLFLFNGIAISYISFYIIFMPSLN